MTLCPRDGLRSGDVFVPGSRRYADPSTYLYAPRQWAPRQEEYGRLVGKPAAAVHALEQGRRHCTRRPPSWSRPSPTPGPVTPGRSAWTATTTWWCRRCRLRHPPVSAHPVRSGARQPAARRCW
ncbi:MAG: hypothetical protein ABSA53_14375 [Streptosporangiaceae bacterium]